MIPTIKDISSTDWDGNPLKSNDPLLLECHIEIGELGREGVDYFTMAVANRRWIQSHIPSFDEFNALPRWLDMRATLLSATPSFQEVIDCVENQITRLGPYASWPEFAQKTAKYIVWEFEGLPYPPA